jgi:hypothetical protein
MDNFVKAKCTGINSEFQTNCNRSIEPIVINKKQSKYFSIFIVLLILASIIICCVTLVKTSNPTDQEGACRAGVKRLDEEVNERFVNGGTVYEHLTTPPANNNKESKDYDMLMQEILRLKAQIKGTNPNKMYNIKNVRVTPPALATAGTHILTGPIVNKVLDNQVLSRYSNDNQFASPFFTKKPSFLETTQHWTYNIDGTIRNTWDKIDNKMGSCMTTNGKNVTLTKKTPDCSKWTWDSYGRLVLREKGDVVEGHNKCLVPVTVTGSTTTALGIQECNNNKIESKQLWSFNAM